MAPTRSLVLAGAAIAAGAITAGAGYWADATFTAGVMLLMFGLVLAGLGLWALFRAPPNRPETLGLVAFLALVFGGILLWLGWVPWCEYLSSEPEPQTLSLRRLQEQGYGNNRHVRVTDFAFCDGHVLADDGGLGKRYQLYFKQIWVPIVPLELRTRKGGRGETVPVPRKVLALVYTDDTNFRVPEDLAPERAKIRLAVQRLSRGHREEKGWQGLVVTGLKPLTQEERERLLELAPDTDVDSVLLLRFGPPEASQVLSMMGGGLGLALFGAGLSAALLLSGKPTERLANGEAPEQARPERDAAPG